MQEEVEEFKIMFDEKEGKVDVMIAKGLGEKIWRWIKSGTNRILNISTIGLASTADRIRSQLETRLGGDWQVSQITLTISSNPAATVTIERKSS